ncbi:MAG: YkgJ family cysteine cluster protein [Chlamydiae bacterium]|nr:YkgJ family cysteine cluster protein [Chlamydiota bacterium]
MTKALSWIKEGLKFKCTQCGACCTGTPGYVWVSDEEIIEMSNFLKVTVEHFIKKFTRNVSGKRALLERPKTLPDLSVVYDCTFLKDNVCTLYNYRPRQCRTYPWWPENIASKKAWEDEGTRCEGINHPDAETISLEEIQQQLSLN